MRKTKTSRDGRTPGSKHRERDMNYWVNEPPIREYTWMARIHKETCNTVA